MPLDLSLAYADLQQTAHGLPRSIEPNNQNYLSML